MKAKLLLIAILSLALHHAHAQFVDIPDSNFRKVLIALYPSCFNENKQMDTTCSGIVYETKLRVPAKGIKNLEGVQYFDYLMLLDCSSNSLTSLPSLLSRLSELYCNLNQLTSLPNLPRNLSILDCSYNQLTSLPSLPSSLDFLTCSYNQITSLPELPFGLYTLVCQANNLKSLPTLPITLKWLMCKFNLFSCLPFLPDLDKFEFDRSLIKCLPNKPALIASQLTSIPICNEANNLSQCQTYPQLRGKVFIDANKDELYTQGENFVPNTPIRASNKNQMTVFTNSNGEYSIIVDTLGSFTFIADVFKNYALVPSSKTANFTYYGEEVIQDFAMQANNNAEDLNTKLSARNLARPGFPLSFELSNSNVGTVDGTAFQSFHFPTEYIIDSISDGGSESSTGTVTWSSASMSPFAQTKLRVYGHLSSSTTLGTKLAFYSRISPNSTTDVDMSNNIDSTILVVRGSFDPNDKAATPILSPSQVANGTAIDYTVRFQNTGTDTAFTVVIMDTLTSNLQANTLELVSSSHSCKTTVKGNVVSFEFLKILLPDSSNNESKSHGYVRFKVKPKSTLVLGNKVNNRAAIYFDYNKPVITNTAVTEIKIPDVVTGFGNNSFTDKLALHPNPAISEVILSENGKVEVYTLEGVLVLSTNVQHNTMDISSLSKGIYFLRLNTANGQRKSVKMVKD